jgi:hypothetical protein
MMGVSCLGMIVRYYEDAPTYAWYRRGDQAFTVHIGAFVRIGALTTDQAAPGAWPSTASRGTPPEHQGELTHPRSLAVPYAQVNAITTLSR